MLPLLVWFEIGPVFADLFWTTHYCPFCFLMGTSDLYWIEVLWDLLGNTWNSTQGYLLWIMSRFPCPNNTLTHPHWGWKSLLTLSSSSLHANLLSVPTGSSVMWILSLGLVWNVVSPLRCKHWRLLTRGERLLGN